MGQRQPHSPHWLLLRQTYCLRSYYSKEVVSIVSLEVSGAPIPKLFEVFETSPLPFPLLCGPRGTDKACRSDSGVAYLMKTGCLHGVGCFEQSKMAE